MKKKFKPVTDISQLVGGQIYIRVVINFLGRVWLEYNLLHGKTKKRKDSTGAKVTKLTVTSLQSFSYEKPKPILWYPYDFGVFIQTGPKQRPVNMRCYPYSNALDLYLKSILDNKRALIDFMSNYKISDEEFDDFLFYCEVAK